MVTQIINLKNVSNMNVAENVTTKEVDKSSRVIKKRKPKFQEKKL